MARCIFAFDIISMSQSIRELLLDKLVLWKKKKWIAASRLGVGILGQKWNLFRMSGYCRFQIALHGKPATHWYEHTEAHLMSHLVTLIRGILLTGWSRFHCSFLSWPISSLSYTLNSQHSTLPPLLSDHVYIMHERKESEQSMLLAMHASMVSWGKQHGRIKVSWVDAGNEWYLIVL